MRDTMVELRARAKDMQQQRDLQDRVVQLRSTMGWALVAEKEAVRLTFMHLWARMHVRADPTPRRRHPSRRRHPPSRRSWTRSRRAPTSPRRQRTARRNGGVCRCAASQTAHTAPSMALTGHMSIIPYRTRSRHQEKRDTYTQRADENRQRIETMTDAQRPHTERIAAASAEIKKINASKADLEVGVHVDPVQTHFTEAHTGWRWTNADRGQGGRA